jgi:hypothetical protein
MKYKRRNVDDSTVRLNITNEVLLKIAKAYLMSKGYAMVDLKMMDVVYLLSKEFTPETPFVSQNTVHGYTYLKKFVRQICPVVFDNLTEMHLKYKKKDLFQ